MRIYLACPISGRTMEEVNGWKEKWKKEFSCLDPTAGERWEGFCPHRNDHGWNMFRTDKFKMQMADVIVINVLGWNNLSGGCCVEKGMADAWGKLVVLIAEKNNPHRIDMVEKGAIVCESEKEALNYLTTMEK